MPTVESSLQMYSYIRNAMAMGIASKRARHLFTMYIYIYTCIQISTYVIIHLTQEMCMRMYVITCPLCIQSYIEFSSECRSRKEI